MRTVLKRLLRATGLRKSARERWNGTDPLEAVPLPEPRDVRGRLRIWVGNSRAEPDPESNPMRTTWVPGPSYRGMRNNDLRGYLDGRYQYAWNQVSQAHVRIGRLASWVKYGEYELFRVLHRWTDVLLPQGARVVGARLVLGVEAGPRIPLRIFAYRVRREWHPGEGGRLKDNVSPPADGETWWNETAHGTEEWGLPGAGYAAADDPMADTDAEPLAHAAWAPGAAHLSFASPAFTAYCDEAVGAGDAIRLLLKLSDVQEDVPGTLLTVYGADQGDDRTLDRRPRLVLDWTAPGTVLDSRSIHLEHGRSLNLPTFEAGGGGWRWIDFDPDDGSTAPAIDVLEPSDSTGGWRGVFAPFESDHSGVTVRVRALSNPVEWGDAFTARFRDTWIRSGPPEEQRIPWRFTSPTGVEHEVLAVYSGDSTWTASFVPNEVGPWRYEWSHTLAGPKYRSAPGAFDVVVADREQGIAALRTLVEQAERVGVRQRPVEGRRLMAAFARLERAVLSLATPDTWRSEEFGPLRESLDKAREALWGSAVPRDLPMEPCRPPEWANE